MIGREVQRMESCIKGVRSLDLKQISDYRERLRKTTERDHPMKLG
jgi:hypothetical protein